MTIDRIRALFKKLAPVLVAGAVLGGGGSVAARRYLAADCCAPGSACCHPGAACCHGHGHAAPGAVASR